MNSPPLHPVGSMSYDRIPPELSAALYSKAIELAKNGLGGIRIARELSRRYPLAVCPGTINHWIYGDREPRIRNVFETKPSPQLSYIIGANMGDGCKLLKSGCVKLEVTDLDFAEAFNSSMATLFSRKRPNKVLKRVFPGLRLPIFVVKYTSRQLTCLLSRSMRELLELAFAYPREFLRAFFDAEGHVDVGIGRYFQLAVGVENSDKRLLYLIRHVLKGVMGIESRVYRKREAGSIKVIRGKAFSMRRTSYALIIQRLADVRRFDESIGFSISRKSLNLKDALSILTYSDAKERPTLWRRHYSKLKGEWVRRGSPLPGQSKGIKEELAGLSGSGRSSSMVRTSGLAPSGSDTS